MALAEDVLDLARWAPSGDNSQPWRFVLRGAHAFDVYGYDTRAHCVYDLDGWASELSHGILLETIVIAAARHGARAHIDLPDAGDARPRRYRVTLEAGAAPGEDAHAAVITSRTVQRRPMRPRPLAPGEREALERAAAPFRVVWFDNLRARMRIAALCAANARIRLTIPEAYAVHRQVIAWHAANSDDRMPDGSLGAGPLLLAIMRCAMSSWERLERVNRWSGTLAPRLALDFVPGVLCSASLALIAEQLPATLADRIAAGRATQRLWLAATMLGLQMQPQYTPLVFARYAREGRAFTRVASARRTATHIAARLDALLGSNAAENAVWLARIGPGRSVPGRSLRLPLSALLVTDPLSDLPPLAADARAI